MRDSLLFAGERSNGYPRLYRSMYQDELATSKNLIGGRINPRGLTLTRQKPRAQAWEISRVRRAQDEGRRKVFHPTTPTIPHRNKPRAQAWEISWVRRAQDEGRRKVFHPTTPTIPRIHPLHHTAACAHNPPTLCPNLVPHHHPPCRCCLLYTSPSPRDRTRSRMPSSA